MSERDLGGMVFLKGGREVLLCPGCQKAQVGLRLLGDWLCPTCTANEGLLRRFGVAVG